MPGVTLILAEVHEGINGGNYSEHGDLYAHGGGKQYNLRDLIAQCRGN